MKPRPDSYEATLSQEQREDLHALLSQPDLSLAAVRLLCPKWSRGPRDGSLPSIRALSEIGARLRRERMLLDVDATAKLMEAVRSQVKLRRKELASGESIEETLDLVCDVVGQEVLQKTVEGADPKNRTAALRALLKRADQKILDRRVKLLEAQAAQAEKAKGVLEDKELSEAERAAKMRQIFGLA
jgi:hypothetical protein